MSDKPTLAEMSVAVLRAIHDHIYSRGGERVVGDPHITDEDDFDAMMDKIAAAPSVPMKGVVWHDGKDPTITLSGDHGPGSVTVHVGTVDEPFRTHTHAGAGLGGGADAEEDFAAFVHGLWLHFQGEGLSWAISMSEIEVNKE